MPKYDYLWIKKTITVSGGSGSTSFTLYKDIKHLLIEAPNQTGTFKARIKDADGKYHTRTMRVTSSGEGLLSTVWASGLPMRGLMTLEITNASLDGSYSMTIMYPNT